MGIHKLLPNLPGVNIVTDTKHDLQKLKVEECTVALDAGNLLFRCTLPPKITMDGSTQSFLCVFCCFLT
jgi:hypothetical protein